MQQSGPGNVTINNPGSVTVNGGKGGTGQPDPDPPKTRFQKFQKDFQDLAANMGKAAGAVGALDGAVSGLPAVFSAGLSAITGMSDKYVSLFNPAAVFKFELATRDLNASIGEALLPVMEKATVLTRAVADGIAGLTPQGKMAIAVLGGAAVGLAVTAAAAGALAVALNAASFGIPALVSGVAALGLGAAAGAATVMGSVGDFSKAMAGFKEVFSLVFETLGGVVVKLAAGLQPGMAAAAEGVGTAFKAVFGSLAGAGDVAGGFGRAFGSIMAAGGKLVGFLGQLSAPFVGLSQVIGAVLGPALEGLGMGLNLVMMGLKPLGAALSAVGAAWGRVAGVVSRTLESVMGALRPAIAAMEDASDRIAHAIGGAFTQAFESALPFIENAAEVIGRVMVKVAEAFTFVATTAAGLAEALGFVRPPDAKDKGSPSEGKSVRNVQSGSAEAAIMRQYQNSLSAGRGGADPMAKVPTHVEQMAGDIQIIREAIVIIRDAKEFVKDVGDRAKDFATGAAAVIAPIAFNLPTIAYGR